VDNFYVFISLVSTKEERRAAFRKAKNNLKAKADAGDTGAHNKLKGFNIDKLHVWIGPQNMGAFPTIKPGVQLPQDIYGRIAPRWNHMIRVLTKQGKQGVPPEFDTVLTTHASYQLLDKYCILPGQEANSSQNEKLNFEKIRTQFIADCSNAVKQGVKSVLLGQKPIAFAGAAVSAPQTSTVAAAATNTSTPTTAATVPPAAGEALANTIPPNVKSRGRSRSRHGLDEWGSITARFQFWSSNRRRANRATADRRTSHGHVTGEQNAALGARQCISGCH